MERLSDEEVLWEVQRRFGVSGVDLAQHARLVKELETLNKRLLQSEEMKSNFLSNIRNEINNPLTSILGLSMHIASCDTNSYDKVKEMALKIYAEAFDLNFQIRNIVVAAELEAGEKHPEFAQVNLFDLLNTQVSLFLPQASKKHILIQTEISSLAGKVFLSDAYAVQLIVANLISNAIAFSPVGSTIKVEGELENNMAVLKVTDAGKGISQEDISKIFDRFVQLIMGTRRESEGQGLGLAVSKALAEIINGKIEVVSSSKGSVFTLLLPAAVCSASGIDFASSGDELFFI